MIGRVFHWSMYVVALVGLFVCPMILWCVT